MTKKYYIEFYESNKQTEYIAQSQWFDSVDDARKWFKYFGFIRKDIKVSIMTMSFDCNGEEMGDIEEYERL